jgi:hypothetical protein
LLVPLEPEPELLPVPVPLFPILPELELEPVVSEVPLLEFL